MPNTNHPTANVLATGQVGHTKTFNANWITPQPNPTKWSICSVRLAYFTNSTVSLLLLVLLVLSNSRLQAVLEIEQHLLRRLLQENFVAPI